MRHLIPYLALAACASSSPQQRGSRGPRADEHLAAAQDHTTRAEELSRWPDRHASSPEQPIDTGSWYRSFDTVSNELRMARDHRSSAAQLLAEYDEACGQRSYAEVSISPIERYAVGGTQTENGVVLFLPVEAGSPEALMAGMRCHRAWMMLGRTDMEACPLDLAKIRIDAHGDASGITVEITTTDKLLVPELQRRAAHDLETAAQRRSAAPH